MLPTRAHYAQLMNSLRELSELERHQKMRYLVRTDLYFLLRYVMDRPDMDHPWMLEKIRQVQAKPDGCLDLWARDHRKSTIITFAKTVQDILASHGEDPLPEWNGVIPTFGIFSHTRPIAKAFLRQIKREFESNEQLRELFPDVIWQNPQRDAPTWSEDSGIVLRRRTNPKEATVEAYGLVDGQPTGKHFTHLIDDDVVTLESVNSPDMIEKTTNAWAMHLNLGTTDVKIRIIGTRYHFNDTYREIMARGVVSPRLGPATADGTLTGRPVYLSQEQFDGKVRSMGPYVASAQLLLNPIADSKHTFNRTWLRYYDRMESAAGMNVALLCDPANEKKKQSDWTTMAVVAKGPDHNYYLLDALRDRLNLQERAQAYMDMHRRWKPRISGYEKYGKDSDISYIKEIQTRDNYRFDIVELGGKLSKVDRINRLIPTFFEGRFWMPRSIMKTNYEHKLQDLISILVEEEMLVWPVPVHDDFLDVIARVEDIDMPWPKGAEQAQKRDRYSNSKPAGTWMSAA